MLGVQKPGRYTGGELNAVVKDKKQVDVRFAFCFPDIYEVGMSHLGMKILYSQFNEVPYIWCERVFAPWVDMEEELRKRDIPLYGLESGDPITNFDFIGFTLQYELSYTNVLNMLELAKIPLLAKDRGDLLGQIVVAGGPCVCNPEPLCDFIDLFFLGEGEEVDLEVIELYRACRAEGVGKREFLRRAVQIEGVYVPSLYEISYHEDGTLAAITPKEGAPSRIRKRIIRDMDTCYYPENFVVPFLDIVHDRAVEEVLRGCIRGCRFCQAGFIYRPVREKSPETVARQCAALCGNTGYDEVSLSSLSTNDYTALQTLLADTKDWAEREKISLSLPSMRVDAFSDELVQSLQSLRRSGLTFAPEAGTQRMRDVINKNVTQEELLDTCRRAFRAGWTTVKLYFMIGLPTETLDDVAGIADLGQAVVDEFYALQDRPRGKSVQVTLSASAFVPKPFTPFQWVAQDTVESFREKQRHFVGSTHSRKIKCNYHDAEASVLEGAFARGDRRLGAVLLRAQQSGCRLDGWGDFFSYDRWMQAFDECGIDPAFYSHRARGYEELLPWDHLDYGVSKAFLRSEYEKALKAQTTPNCREKCSGCGAACWKAGVCVADR